MFILIIFVIIIFVILLCKPKNMCSIMGGNPIHHTVVARYGSLWNKEVIIYGEDHRDSGDKFDEVMKEISEDKSVLWLEHRYCSINGKHKYKDNLLPKLCELDIKNKKYVDNRGNLSLSKSFISDNDGIEKAFDKYREMISKTEDFSILYKALSQKYKDKIEDEINRYKDARIVGYTGTNGMMRITSFFSDLEIILRLIHCKKYKKIVLVVGVSHLRRLCVMINNISDVVPDHTDDEFIYSKIFE